MFLGAEREARKGFTVKQPKQISDKTEHPKRTGDGMERGSCTWAQNQAEKNQEAGGHGEPLTVSPQWSGIRFEFSGCKF